MESIFLPTKVPVGFDEGPATTGMAAEDAPIAVGSVRELEVDPIANGDGAFGANAMLVFEGVVFGSSPDNDGHILFDLQLERRRPPAIKTSVIRENIIFKNPPYELRTHLIPI
jgi:hypothetical protein